MGSGLRAPSAPTATGSNDPADWEELARAVGREAFAADDPTHLHQLLTFLLDDVPYAVPVERVREIVRIRPVTPVPRAPEAVRGVISLRGEILQVLDLRRLLSLAMPAGASRHRRIVVVHGDDGRVAGLLVDEVREVLRIGEDALRPAPGDSENSLALCVRGEEFVSLLDLDRILAIDADA